MLLTVRDVPDEVRDILARDARERGQSLQAYLLAVLTRQAAFSRNRDLIAAVERDLAAGGGAGVDAPDAADLIGAARASLDRSRGSRPTEADDTA